MASNEKRLSYNIWKSKATFTLEEVQHHYAETAFNNACLARYMLGVNVV